MASRSFCRERCDRAFRMTYRAYEFLRDNAVEESNTSRVLHESDDTFLNRRLVEEFGEFRQSFEAFDPALSHTGTREGDMVLEGHQVWYWLALRAVARHVPYGTLDPAGRLESGYSGARKWLRHFDGINGDILGVLSPAMSARNALGYIGLACREAGIDPCLIPEHDLEAMGSKAYLKDVLGD